MAGQLPQAQLFQYWMQAAQQALTYPAAFRYWVLLSRGPAWGGVRTRRTGWLAGWLAHALVGYQEWGQQDPARQAVAPPGRGLVTAGVSGASKWAGLPTRRKDHYTS